MTSRKRDRFALYVSAFLATGSIFLLAVTATRRYAEAKVRENVIPTFVGSKSESSGTEIVMIVIGSSQCGASTNQLLPPLLKRARSSLSETTLKDGKLFATMGVAIDWSIADGMSFLRSTGPYSEVVAGRNWLNSAAVSFLWRDHSGRAALPQVIVVERDIRIDDANVHVGADRVLSRIVGLDSIRLWVDNGARISAPATVATRAVSLFR